MRIARLFVVSSSMFLIVVSSAFAQEIVDLIMVDKIRDEGFNRSQAMELVWYMTDVYGPRGGNSPSYNQATQWAKKKFEEWGSENVKLDPYAEIGMPWECTFNSVHMNTPQYLPLIAYAVSHTRGTNGKVISNAVYVNTQEIFSETDLQKYRGKLRGKIVLTMPLAPIKPDFEPSAIRLSKELLDDMVEKEMRIIPLKETVTITLDEYNALLQGDIPQQPLSSAKINEFFENEGVAVLIAPSRFSVKGPKSGGRFDGPFTKGLVGLLSGQPVPKGGHKPLPRMSMAAEHYNRIFRLIEKGFNVEMEVEIRVIFHENDREDYNVIAEIPGTDLKDEIILIGGHFDGIFGGTGATDNATGAAMVMEAIRILKAVDAQPRRTIRAALWGGHDAGHSGAGYYISKYIQNPETKKTFPEHAKLSIYLNTDWYGRFLGVYLNGNDLVRPIFEAWMKPFEDIGMTHLLDNSGGSDHMRFIRVGIPSFQWIQDYIEYHTSNHHTNMDVYDRIVPEDMMQGSVINASWAYFAAMRDEMIPRSTKTLNNNGR